MLASLILAAGLALRPVAASAPVLGATAESGARDRSAIDAYRRGDFETAKALWLAALSEGDAGQDSPPSSAERARILYDVGNAVFRKGNPLEAVGWYTASLRLRPRDADTWKNLEHARATAKLEPADRGDLAATFSRLVGSLTPAESQWLAIAAAGVWCLVLVGEAFRGGRILRRIALVGALTTACALVPWASHRFQSRRDPVLVLDASDHGADLKSEPRADATIVGSVPSGQEVDRVDELPGWIKVEVPGGNSGWIDAHSIFPLVR